eukprot:14465248-Ditylum_brightwellii.AAC.1
MAKNTVDKVDAIMAVIVIESSMHTSLIFNKTDTLHTDFAEDPHAHYMAMEATILERLNSFDEGQERDYDDEGYDDDADDAPLRPQDHNRMHEAHRHGSYADIARFEEAKHWRNSG